MRLLLPPRPSLALALPRRWPPVSTTVHPEGPRQAEDTGPLTRRPASAAGGWQVRFWPKGRRVEEASSTSGHHCGWSAGRVRGGEAFSPSRNCFSSSNRKCGVVVPGDGCGHDSGMNRGRPWVPPPPPRLGQKRLHSSGQLLSPSGNPSLEG